MLNKNFQGWLRRNKETNLLNKFSRSLENLYEKKLVKINTSIQTDFGESIMFCNYKHEINSYKNLTYFRLYDLGTSLTPTIENKNYTAAVLISRGIFETILITSFRLFRLEKFINKKDWKSLHIEILNFKFVPSWKEDEDSDINWDKAFPHIKKFHINDAIRVFSKISDDEIYKKVEKKLFEDYSEMSDISHPNQANRSLYINQRDQMNLIKYEKKILRDNFSVNHADETVFPIFRNLINYFLTFDKACSSIWDEVLKNLELYKNELIKYEKSDKFQDDLEESQPLFAKVNELRSKGLNNEQITDELVKASYKKNE
jgi:hypothetical protein|tara:strand:+ start:188 stop:1135 length:948 start_codon:yes stop_codon:yes gene_type:complete